mmetsp:Transcript_2923/g.7848  ORF Transcript_2923/g.7848 Transcript_2923/m.7848 type:complete len:216 (-) Transcript_2923:103-750(-)
MWRLRPTAVAAKDRPPSTASPRQTSAQTSALRAPRAAAARSALGPTTCARRCFCATCRWTCCSRRCARAWRSLARCTCAASSSTRRLGNLGAPRLSSLSIRRTRRRRRRRARAVAQARARASRWRAGSWTSTWRSPRTTRATSHRPAPAQAGGAAARRARARGRTAATCTSPRRAASRRAARSGRRSRRATSEQAPRLAAGRGLEEGGEEGGRQG